MRSWVCGLTFFFCVLQGQSQVLTNVTLKKGAVVPLRLLDQISTKDSINGEVVHFEALRDISAQRHLLIHAGATASGTVDFVAKSWKGLQGGQLRIILKQVELADGEPLALNSEFDAYGGGANRTSTLGKVQTAATLLSPTDTVLTLAVGGQEVVFPKGTRMDGYVADTVSLDPAKFAIAEVSWTTVSGDPLAPPDQPRKESLQVSTTVGDGSIFVDGAFRAEAPAKLEIERGMHLITVRRDGYKLWKARVLVDGERIELSVAMEKR